VIPDAEIHYTNGIFQHNLLKSKINLRRILMKIPSKKECFNLIYKMNMPEHIINHSIQVTQVALFLTDQLISINNGGLNRDLILSAALLHDITKTRSFETGENHAETGGQLLRDLEFPEVGNIIAQHVRLQTYNGFDIFPDEAEIVNYSDKRILHDKVVSFSQRMEYILERYGKIPEHRERILWLWNKSIELENKIFSYLSFAPGDLTDKTFVRPLEIFRHNNLKERS
jgi:uncharacterized protein